MYNTVGFVSETISCSLQFSNLSTSLRSWSFGVFDRENVYLYIQGIDSAQTYVAYSRPVRQPYLTYRPAKAT
jgi:hypothetical protein